MSFFSLLYKVTKSFYLVFYLFIVLNVLFSFYKIYRYITLAVHDKRGNDFGYKS